MSKMRLPFEPSDRAGTDPEAASGPEAGVRPAVDIRPAPAPRETEPAPRASTAREPAGVSSLAPGRRARRRASAPAAPLLSVIVPCANEGRSLPAMVRALVRTFPAEGPVDAEFIFVDDGSTDGTARLLQRIHDGEPRVVPVLRPDRGGQTRALWDGLARARGEWIAHLDGDLQNDPDDLLAMLARAGDEYDAVFGFRERRCDRWSRRIAGRVAGAVRRAVLRDHIRDIGCSTRIVRREALAALPPVRDLHRYLPALLERAGWRTLQVPVRHHARRYGRSKYTNLGRGLRGIVDLVRMARFARRRLPHARRS